MASDAQIDANRRNAMKSTGPRTEEGKSASRQMKTDGHLDRNLLKGRHGDHANAVLSAAGYNFHQVRYWLRDLLRRFPVAVLAVLTPDSAFKNAF